ncbi:MAG: UbiD family decarboxylase [Chloroflexi bacterium]|nr:UbiD family decarboxylase [Chloroflexota bacterium]
MAYRDLREFITLLERKRLLARVKAEVDPAWEINGITNKLINEAVTSGKSPAVIFEKVKGHKVPVLCNLIGTLERLALALETESADERVIREEWLKRIGHPIPPKKVKTGPCKENILTGEKADFNAIFPPVIWHKGDGGAYIGTLAIQVTKDPETGVQNAGIYRMMVRTKNETGLMFPAVQHAGQHLGKWRRLFPGKPMPVAIAIGTDPVYLLAAGAKFHHPPSEDDYAGALRKEPLELVKCETCDLTVPATSEIVLEGEVYPDELKPDGPFGEYTGHQGAAQMLNVFHLKTITHRDNPIFLGEREGYPSETGLISLKSKEYLIYERLRKLPGVIDVHMPREGCAFKLIIALRKSWPGHVNQIIQSVWGDLDLGLSFRYIVVVDEGVDIRNPAHVEWAVSNYVQPDRDILIAPRSPGGGGGLDVSQPYSKRRWSAKWGVDATLPTEEYEAEGTKAPELCDDPDIKAKVEAQWGKYGINP